MCCCCKFIVKVSAFKEMSRFTMEVLRSIWIGVTPMFPRVAVGCYGETLYYDAIILLAEVLSCLLILWWKWKFSFFSVGSGMTLPPQHMPEWSFNPLQFPRGQGFSPMHAISISHILYLTLTISFPSYKVWNVIIGQCQSHFVNVVSVFSLKIPTGMKSAFRMTCWQFWVILERSKWSV